MPSINFFRLGAILFFYIFLQHTANGQSVDVALNYTQTGETVYNKNNIERYRRTYKIATGKVFLSNRSDIPISFQLYHSDSPEKPYSTTKIGAKSSGYCTAIVANDWGIQFEMGGAKSDIFFLQQLGNYSNGEFRLTYYGYEQVEKGAPMADPIESIQIGDQTWTKNNLDRERFRNGDIIEQAKTKDDWELAELFGGPRWCYLNFDPANESKYGKLYNEDAIKDRRMLAPRGYHIATTEDWAKLRNHYGDESIMIKKIMGGNGWNDKTGNDGLFQAAAGGFILNDGTFKIDYSHLGSLATEFEVLESMTKRATWWISPSQFIVLEEVVPIFKRRRTEFKFVRKSDNPNWSGFSVRCVKD
jgi:uncharacterized protein (TIGR02145 family)